MIASLKLLGIHPSLAKNNFFKLKTFDIKKIVFNEDFFLNLQLDFKISRT